jgi:lipopolysaccharide transport system ATP-binding protein
VLSQVTAPSKGEVRFKGRIASLLEVGTGFHPELTGRENIFLNGAILGMNKVEIRKKLDEIIDFAEVEKFIDTPVKRYSSGMYVRLAFAVAAHLEPEILVIDEVLAVGDAQFQRKCIGKMQDVGKEGRTVLFVSHNMQAIRQLCDSAVMLQGGEVVLIGQSAAVIERYLKDAFKNDDSQNLEEVIRNLPPDPTFRLDGISLKQNGQTTGSCVESAKPLEVEIKYSVFSRTAGLRVYFDLCDDQDTLLFRSFHDEDSDGIPVTLPGKYMSRATIPENLLGPMKYELRVRCGIFNVRSCLPASGIIFPFTVEQTGDYNRAYLGDTFRGKFALAIKWLNEKHN